eukprot:c5224_g1_i2.p1 GENE.c5224_g1_i2~~c5224_g1_i2.p1  ORF type:complete len:157 (+),score=50.42 c5224_g1_i2:26-496(+)
MHVTSSTPTLVVLLGVLLCVVPTEQAPPSLLSSTSRSTAIDAAVPDPSTVPTLESLINSALSPQLQQTVSIAMDTILSTTGGALMYSGFLNGLQATLKLNTVPASNSVMKWLETNVGPTDNPTKTLSKGVMMGLAGYLVFLDNYRSLVQNSWDMFP